MFALAAVTLQAAAPFEHPVAGAAPTLQIDALDNGTAPVDGPWQFHIDEGDFIFLYTNCLLEARNSSAKSSASPASMPCSAPAPTPPKPLKPPSTSARMTTSPSSQSPCWLPATSPRRS
ncbi:MAG TPA: hypothetical protein VGT08_07075 [Terracidiphilus sp.]|nr:hypothetical protein [Terracidiphilus sp.]